MVLEQSNRKFSNINYDYYGIYHVLGRGVQVGVIAQSEEMGCGEFLCGGPPYRVSVL